MFKRPRTTPFFKTGCCGAKHILPKKVLQSKNKPEPVFLNDVVTKHYIVQLKVELAPITTFDKISHFRRPGKNMVDSNGEVPTKLNSLHVTSVPYFTML